MKTRLRCLPVAWLGVLLFSGQATAAGHCALEAKDVIGAWQTIDGNGFFEQFELSTVGRTRSFNSWLHDRPDILDASWQLHQCQLVIRQADSPMAPFVYRVSFAHRHLVLRDDADRTTATHARVPDNP